MHYNQYVSYIHANYLSITIIVVGTYNDVIAIVVVIALIPVYIITHNPHMYAG